MIAGVLADYFTSVKLLNSTHVAVLLVERFGRRKYFVCYAKDAVERHAMRN